MSPLWNCMLIVCCAFLEQYNNYISVYISWNHVIFHDACTDTTNYLIMPFSKFPFLYNMTTWDTAPNIIVHIQQGYRPRLYDIYLSKDRFTLHSPLPSPHKLFYLVFYNILHKFILWISAQLYNHIFWNLSECSQEIHQNIQYRLLNSIQLIVETEKMLYNF
jgi:hypothetical protein